jgi:hypothetical protein
MHILGVAMKRSLVLAAFLLCGSSGAYGQTPTSPSTQTPVNCREFSGTACILTPGTQQISSSDYGAIYVRLEPPTDVDEQAVKAKKNDWKNILRRFFIKDAKTGAVTAEIFNEGKLITIIPVALFSIDEKKGLTIDSQAQFTSFQQVSPFLRLDSVANAVTIKISLRSSKQPTSSFLSNFALLSNTALSFGASGYLLNDSGYKVTEALDPIEKYINQNFSVLETSKLEFGLNFEENSGSDFNYGFKPDGTGRTGRIAIQLNRRGSLLGSFPFKSNLPVYTYTLTTSVSDANNILQAKYSGSTWLQRLQQAPGNPFGTLTSPAVTPDAFETACSAVEGALTSQGINTSDTTTLMWAVFTRAGGVKSPTLRASPCASRWASTFSVYSLPLPPTDPLPLSAAQQATIQAGLDAEYKAKQAEAQSQASYSRASMARAETFSSPEAMAPGSRRIQNVPGVRSYRGEPITVDSEFYGSIVHFRSNPSPLVQAGGPTEVATGEEYIGTLRAAGTVLIRTGNGRVAYTGSSVINGVVAYSGQFANELIQGYGVMTWDDGRQFRGQFANGNPRGTGVLKYANGESFIVQYVDGGLDPMGIRIEASGNYTIGKFDGSNFVVR